MSLRGSVPPELAQWLDAHSVEGEVDFGRPGYADLRSAWVGRLPQTAIEDSLPEWLLHQRAHQVAAQRCYEMLMEVEPLGLSDDGNPVIPGWFGTWWAEILLSHPWDEQLSAAVTEAYGYLASQGGINGSAGEMNDDGRED